MPFKTLANASIVNSELFYATELFQYKVK